jgi:hypothetical protein
MEYFKAEQTGRSDVHEATLLAEEENIIRYACGYRVCGHEDREEEW